MGDQDQQSLKEGAYSDEKVYVTARLDSNEKKELSNVKVIWIVGGPGAGKGTQLKNIAEKYNCSVIGGGDLIRKEISENTDLGKEMESMLEKERTVPNEIVWDLVIEATKAALSEKHDYIIFDCSYTIRHGILQVEHFEKDIGPCDLILNLEIDEDTMKTRIQQKERRIDDQKMKRVEHRIAVYQENVDLILKEAEERNYKIVEVDAAQSEDEVFKLLCNEIEKLKENKYSTLEELKNNFFNFLEKMWPRDDDNGEGLSTQGISDLIEQESHVTDWRNSGEEMDTILTELNLINSKLDLISSKLDLINSAFKTPTNDNTKLMEKKNNID